MIYFLILNINAFCRYGPLKWVQKMRLIYMRLMYFSRYSFNYLHHELKYFEVKWVEKMWLISGRLNFASELLI